MLFIILFDTLVLFEWQMCTGRNNGQGSKEEITQEIYAEIQYSSDQENPVDFRIAEKIEEETEEELIKLNVHVKVNV